MYYIHIVTGTPILSIYGTVYVNITMGVWGSVPNRDAYPSSREDQGLGGVSKCYSTTSPGCTSEARINDTQYNMSPWPQLLHGLFEVRCPVQMHTDVLCSFLKHWRLSTDTFRSDSLLSRLQELNTFPAYERLTATTSATNLQFLTGVYTA